METLETERLILRLIYKDDPSDIYEYGKEQNAGPPAGWKPHKDIDETRVIMKAVFIDKDIIFGMVLKSSGKMIGSIGLMPDPHRNDPEVMMIGYAMSEHYWGKGLMTEAAKAVIEYGFRELAISMISCTCYSINPRSRRVIQKCGFEYEGCLRQGEKRYDGKVLDVECYSLVKSKDK